MKRKTFFLIGYVLSIIIFIIFYSYFWYTIGKYPSRFNDIGTAIMMMIYFIILILVAHSQYQSPYHELKKSMISIMLYAAPLLLIFMMLLLEGGFNTTDIIDTGFTLPLLGIYGLNLLNYVISAFANE